MTMILMMLNLSFAAELDQNFARAQFTLGSRGLSAYVADDDPKRARGLMFVKSLPGDQGMLFVFDHAQPLNFWMKNTLIPLAIGFFDESCRLIDAQEMQVAPSAFAAPPSYQSRGKAKFALEMNAGWFTRRGLKNGVQLKLKGKSPSPRLSTALSQCK